jgi:hypothetical protein
MLEALVCTQDWLRRPSVDIREIAEELAIIQKGTIFPYLLAFVNLLYVCNVTYVTVLCAVHSQSGLKNMAAMEKRMRSHL